MLGYVCDLVITVYCMTYCNYLGIVVFTVGSNYLYNCKYDEFNTQQL